MGLGVAVAHPLAGDVVPARALQVGQVLPGGEPAIHHRDDPSEAPAAQPVADLGQDRLIVGVPGPAPAAHRDPLPGDREPDHDLRQIAAVVLGVPVAAEPPSRRAVGAALVAVVALSD